MSTGRSYIDAAYDAIFQNDFHKAIELFKQAIRCEPNNASYYYRLSITYDRSGFMKKAIETAKKASELEPENQNYRYHLQILQSKNLVLVAVDLMRRNIFTKETKGMLLQAKKLDPLNIDAYLLLGIFYGETNALELSLKEFNSIFFIQPYHLQAKQLKDYYLNLYQEGD
ncbi:tetratricopeptide repeat protein [Tepidibacillus fermentans]|uniref:Tetratricopeptide repeat protein n=1 Tax=Tepidibacillus fermentans TaxID=1281767 RepID=A0A4R3KLC6_9BACI|nr:tetratricopeptide repeat protein [Tepidibacillus fermentans]TCS84156.1 tetratricopeptide repeat protein [Tepidibacillus fermentans]